MSMQRPSEEDDLGEHADHGDGDDMPPQSQAIELLCRCDDIPDDGVELRVLKGLLTAATSSTIHLHGQVRCRNQNTFMTHVTNFKTKAWSFRTGRCI